MRTQLPLITLLGLYLVLGIGYSLATPVGEGPDEPGHLAYVGFLVAHHRLPRYGDSEGPLAAQIKHPPLYYLAGAALTWWADLEGLVFIPNLDFSFDNGDTRSPAAHVHGPDERFPYAERYLAARMVRWLTVCFGLLAVWAVYRIARLLWPAEPALALGSAAVIAFLPQFLFMQGVVNNDGLVNPLAALALLAAIRIALGQTRRRDWVALGTLLGLAMMTKLTMVALLAVGAAAVLIAAYRARAWRLVARAAVYAGGPMLLVTGWWFARNLRLNGDLSGWGRWTAGSESLRHTPLLDELPQYFTQQFQSLWGRFGWMSVPLPDGLYLVLRILTLAALAGLVLLVARTAWRAWARREDESPPDLLATADARWGLVLLVATIALVYLSIFRLAFTWNLVVAQGRYLFTALPAMAVLLALGLAAWLPPRFRPGAMLVLAGGMFALAVYALFGVLVPAYSPLG